MKIGIIGAGQIGGTLVRRFRALGHEVYVANSRGVDSLADLVKETGAIAVSVKEAARNGEVVVITIPQKNVPHLPKDLFQGVPENVVIDTGNYYPQQRDGRIDDIENGMPESQWVERQIGRPVVKVFNNIYAKHLGEHGKPKGTPGRIALPVSGDHSEAKSVVFGLLNELGFDGVDVGGISESWRQQPATPVYGADLDAAGVSRALAEASSVRKPEFRAAL